MSWLPTYPGFNSDFLRLIALTLFGLGSSNARSYLNLDSGNLNYILLNQVFTPSATDQIISCKVNLD